MFRSSTSSSCIPSFVSVTESSLMETVPSLSLSASLNKSDGLALISRSASSSFFMRSSFEWTYCSEEEFKFATSAKNSSFVL